MNKLCFTLCFSLCLSFLQAQTFNDLYDIIQNKCTGCHGGDSPQGNMDLTGSLDDVYNRLVNANPINPSAMSKGYKVAAPGYPEKSYLLYKLSADNWDDTYGLEVADGERMPPEPLEALSKKEIELFRQWILFGAPMNSTVVDPQLLEDYYENDLALPTTVPIDPPAANEGYQMRLGPFFLAPQQEVEYFKKVDLELTQGYEVNELDVKFNDESHHFILYQMNQNIANGYEEGLRNVYDTESAMFSNTLVAVWQNEGEYRLPEYTAYKINPGSYLDLNYHIKNYDDTRVLAANVYLNVFTQDEGTAIQEMYSTLFPISFFGLFLGEELGSDLIIPPGGDETVFTEHLWIPDLPGVPYPSGEWHIWQLSTHTHARGVDYDIFLSEDLSGTKGEQLYEGFNNFDYTFNQGYYDYEHPPIRFFEPLLPVNMGPGAGLVHEATYVNNGDETLQWGPTTNDEMMLVFVHFTEGPVPTSLDDISLLETNNFSVFPNPYQAETNISYKLDQKAKVRLEVFNLLGERVISLVNEKQIANQYNYNFSAKNLGLPGGMYIVNLSIDGATATHKIIEME